MLSNTASVCRWWVYTSSDLVFDKGTHEALSWCCHCLSAGRGNPSFVSEGSSTNSKNLKPSTKTEAVGARWWRWAAQIYMSRPTPPDHGYLASGGPSFHRESSKMFTRTVDHWDASCGETRWDSRLWGFLFKCSAPKDHSVFWTLRVVWAPTPHDAHLIWVDPMEKLTHSVYWSSGIWHEKYFWKITKWLKTLYTKTVAIVTITFE